MNRFNEGADLLAPFADPARVRRAGAGRPGFVSSTMATEASRDAGTLAAPFTLAGRALHSGRRSRVTVAPRPSGGIVFVRGGQEIEATWRSRTEQVLANGLRFPDGRPVRLIEHLLAALSAHGIDHATVSIEGEELPIFDGSALPWCRAIEKAGRQVVPGGRSAIRVLRPVEVRSPCQHLRIEPAERLVLDVRIALAKLGPMRWHGTVTPASFRRDLAPARSFGRLRWAVPAFLWGLAKRKPVLRGALPGTTAVLWGGRVLGGMRVPDEPVRHRALDLVGDLALAGKPILGHVTAVNPGHDINSALVAALMDQPDCWDIVTL